ncbi:MAG: nucleotide sugar dehydrogenase [Candidatus Omnitrophica bacterium]|nr:nucleotide sugar dehydrogenase [Candidatus Omnitrophota bacterium]
MYKVLHKKINNRKAKVGIIGLGYVGLPLAIEFAKAGFITYGIDINKKQIEKLKKGRSYIMDVLSSDIAKLLKSKAFRPTTSYSVIKSLDVIIICVPTPLSKTKEPDISYILSAVKSIMQHKRSGQLIVLESTTYPGTTDEIVLPLLESNGLKCGKDFYLAFSPERVDPANKVYKTKDIPKIVGGINRSSGILARDLYKSVVKDVFLVSSTKTAEMAKLLENTFRSVNIALVNEIALMCNKLGLDVWETIDAAGSKPFGFIPFYPGPGIGGHCIPLDPIYLAWKARLHGFEAKFIDLADRINSGMPEYVVSRIIGILNEKKKTVMDAKVHVIGISYKRDVSDTRESPALEILRLLKNKGADISYSDPYTKECIVEGRRLRAVEPTPRMLKQRDCVAIITDHSAYNYGSIVKNSKLVFDTRNATKNILKKGRRVIKL